MSSNGKSRPVLRRRTIKQLNLSPEHVQAAVTNGTSLLVRVDGRSVWMRRLKDLIRAHVNQLGGPTNLTHAEEVLVRRAAMLTLQCEILERKFAQHGGEAPRSYLDLYGKTSKTLHRLLAATGLQRRAKNVTPGVIDILREGHKTYSNSNTFIPQKATGGVGGGGTQEEDGSS
jgi:hypothetical protein